MVRLGLLESWFACALLTLAPAQSADVTFDAKQHLEGFAACEGDTHAEVWDLARFRREQGQNVSAARLDELKVLWRAERERGLVRKGKILADPRQAAVFAVQQRLHKDQFFREFTWHYDDSHLPFGFLLQRTGNDDSTLRATVTRLMPFLRAASERLERAVLAPTGVPAKPNTVHTVLVLDGRSTWARCLQHHTPSGFFASGAVWLKALDALVLFAEPGRSDGDFTSYAALAQMELALATLHHRCTAAAFRAQWLSLGVASYVARAGDGGAVKPSTYHSSWPRALVAYLLEEPRRPYVAPVEQLVAIPDLDFGEIAAAARRRGVTAKDDQELGKRSQEAYFVQTATLVAYLIEHHGEAFTRCLREALQGRAGLPTLHAGFPPSEVAAMEKAFLAWLRAEHLRLEPGKPLADPLPSPGQKVIAAPKVDAASAAPTPVAADDEDQEQDEPAQPNAAQSTPTPAAPRPRVDPAVLALTGDDWQLQFASAVAAMRAGALGKAAAQLAKINGPDEAARAQVARTLERAKALVELRQRALAPFADGKKILEIEFGNKRARGKVEKLTDTSVAVRAGALQEYELDTIPPAKLDMFARRNNVLTIDAWQSAYLQFLGDGAADKLERKLTAKDATTRALASDAGFYGKVLPLAEPAALLTQLASGSDGAAAVTALEGLLRNHAALPAVASRRAALRQRAAELLEASFDPTDPRHLGVHGKLERPAPGRLRLHWDGKDKAQVEDFAPEPEFMKELSYTTIAPGNPVQVRHVGSTFEITGRGGLRLPVNLTAPLEISLRFKCKGESLLAVFLCDDGLGRNIRVNHAGSITAIADDGEQESAKSNKLMYLNTDYALRIVHDGKQVIASIDGKVVNQSNQIAQRCSGGILLFGHGAPVTQFSQLTVEGSVDDAALAVMRERFVARRLREMFGE